METLKLCWLGLAIVEAKGQRIKLETRKAAALLAYLSLASGASPRVILATMFWPEASQQKALASLRRTLSSLKSSLPGWIEADRETISLKKKVKLWVDVDIFRQLISNVKEHGHSENEICDDCLLKLGKAAELYRGDFLAGLSLDDCPAFDEWQFFLRDELRREFAEILKHLSLEYSERSQWDRAILFARQWAALDSLDEQACRAVMELYDRSGQRNTALRQYEELQQYLKEQLGQEPEDETRRLFERIRRRGDEKISAHPADQTDAFPLLKTKLYIPTRPALAVNRSHLINRLMEVEQVRFTLVSAPAGFGKTTLLSQWITETSLPIAWLSLDSGDNDPYRFLAYLISALEGLQDGIGAEARQLMRSHRPLPPYIILASLLNDLVRLDQNVVLLMDDYHFISEHIIHETVSYLLDHLPINVHLVISSRADPPLQLGRLRANGQMLELRTRDLRFSTSESSEYLNSVLELDLSADDVDILQTRTEGWVVGLKMAALSLRGADDTSEFIQGFSGSHRYILDYLVEEVLRRQPDHIQTFLLYTSILQKLSGSLCEALLSEEWKQSGETGQSALEYLERTNLFVIALDDHKQWYRYHHLFADLLRTRAAQLSSNVLDILHERASLWYERNGLYIEAVDHAFSAHDNAKASCLIEKYAGYLIPSGNYFMILRWIQNFASDEISTRPWLSIWLAWSILASGKEQGVEKLIADAEKGLESPLTGQPVVDPVATSDLSNQIHALRVSLASVQNNPTKTIELAMVALKNVPSNESMHRSNILYPLGNAYFIAGELTKAESAYLESMALSQQTDFLLRSILVTHKVASIYQILGDLQKSFDFYHDMLHLARKNGRQEFFGMGYIYCGIGIIQYEWNNVEQALSMVTEGIRLNEMTGVPMIRVDAYNVMVRILLARGELDQVEPLLEKAEQLIQTSPVLQETREMFEANRVRFWLSKRDYQNAYAWSQDRNKTGIKSCSFERELGDMALGRVAMARGAFSEATRLLNELTKSAADGGRKGRLVEMLLLQAQNLMLQNKPGQAGKKLSESLKIGKAGNYVRLYVDAGEWIIDLLRQELDRDSFNEPGVRAYASGLLEAFDRSCQEADRGEDEIQLQ